MDINTETDNIFCQEIQELLKGQMSQFNSWKSFCFDVLYWDCAKTRNQPLLERRSTFKKFCFQLNNANEQIPSYLRISYFNDNSNYDTNDPARKKLFKICPLMGYLVTKFQSICTLGKNISIDEEPLLWKGRLNFKQYVPNKRSRFGMKFFSLCEDCGYLWNISTLVKMRMTQVRVQCNSQKKELLFQSSCHPYLAKVITCTSITGILARILPVTSQKMEQ